MANPTPPSPTALTPNISKLLAIKNKIRRITRSPSTSQLPDSDLNDYINTFVIYDFPEQIRTFNLATTYSFYTTPGQDIYPTDITSFSGVTTNPLYNFQNLYLTVEPPFYASGYQLTFTESREQFYNMYPKIFQIQSIGFVGDGVTLSYSGFVNFQQLTPTFSNTLPTIGLLQNEILFDSVTTFGAGLAMIDVPIVDTVTGNTFPVGNLYVPGTQPTIPPTVVDINNFIDYQTGQFTVTFPNAPAAGAAINIQSVPVQYSIPMAILYYSNQFVLRPVPNQPYKITFNTFQRPTALLDNNQYPELEEYWQYIAYGAAKKVFEDRSDMDSVQQIMTEFKQQERLCLRRTIVQQTSQRVSTIYSDQTAGNASWNGSGWGSGSF